MIIYYDYNFFLLLLDFNGQCLCWMVLFSLDILCFDDLNSLEYVSKDDKSIYRK
jgi:hypothetical protein